MLNNPLPWIANALKNIGQAITPFAWGTATAIDLPNNGAIYDLNSFVGGFSKNLYHDGTNWRYKAAGAAFNFGFGADGKFAYYTCPVGVADAIATLTRVFDVPAVGIPCFHASRSNTQSSGNILIYDTVQRQDGGTNYDNTTGVFTVPLTGWYMFTFNALMTNNSGASIDDTIMVSCSAGNAWLSDTYLTGKSKGKSGSYIGYFTAGDIARIWSNTGFSATYFANALSHFSGRYLGP